MGKIIVNGIKLYAYHGCTDEEQKIGTNYEIAVTIDAHIEKASVSDLLNDTIDYVAVYEIVKEQMAIKSRLLEHVTKRIIDQLLLKLPSIEKVNVRVSKISPPINGILDGVCVELEETRK